MGMRTFFHMGEHKIKSGDEHKVRPYGYILLGVLLLGMVGCQLVVPDLERANNDSAPGGDTDSDTDSNTNSDSDTDSNTDSDTETEASLSERERCVAEGGYWYDETDVEAETLEAFEALVPTCHETATENCAGLSSIIYARRDNDDFLQTDLSNTTISNYGEDEPSLITHVFSTLRCIPNLASITMRNNSIKKVDLSNNERLAFIDFYHNLVLNDLYIPRIPFVTELHLNNNAISDIDLSNAQSLQVLFLAGNNLTAIDLTHAQSLTNLYLGDNNIVTEIDLSQNNNLFEIQIQGNPVSSLIMPENPTLIQEINAYNTSLTSLDLSGCSHLTYLSVSDSQIAVLTNISDAGSALVGLSADNTRISNLDLSYNIGLDVVSLAGCNLTEVVLPSNSPIYYLDLSYNMLMYSDSVVPVDMRPLSQLRELNLYSNTYLDLTDVVPYIPTTFWETPGAILHIEQAKWLDYAERPDNWVYDTDEWYAMYQ